jgi:polysaccharide export outer membrane protein
MRYLLASVFLLGSLGRSIASAQEPPAAQAESGTIGHLEAKTNRNRHEGKSPNSAYVLGAEDSILIRVLNFDEIGTTPYSIDLSGNLNLPRLGQIHAAGLTIDQLQADLTAHLKDYLKNPVVNISVSEFRSQPVSVFGAVGAPGVHQIRGRMSLFEVISEAGGLKGDPSNTAGNTIIITRQKEYGAIPLQDATFDPTGAFSVAKVSIRSIMDGKNPEENIAVKPYDVITVPKADMIYVIGSVTKPGGYVLSEKATYSVLEILSLAEGLQRTAATNKAKIIRTDENTHVRNEIPLDLKRIMYGKSPDMPLLANDILFVPNSTAKTASARAIDALVQAGTGLAIYGGRL